MDGGKRGMRWDMVEVAMRDATDLGVRVMGFWGFPGRNGVGKGRWIFCDGRRRSFVIYFFAILRMHLAPEMFLMYWAERGRVVYIIPSIFEA